MNNKGKALKKILLKYKTLRLRTNLRHGVHLRQQEVVLLRESRRQRGLEERNQRPHQTKRLRAERQVLGRYGLKLGRGVDGTGSENQLRCARVEHLVGGRLGGGGGAIMHRCGGICMVA